LYRYFFVHVCLACLSHTLSFRFSTLALSRIFDSSYSMFSYPSVFISTGGAITTYLIFVPTWPMPRVLHPSPSPIVQTYSE